MARLVNSIRVRSCFLLIVCFSSDTICFYSIPVVLTILTGEDCVLLIIEIEAWLLLTFFICLHSQLSLYIPLSRIKECQCLKKLRHQVDRKWTAVPFRKFYGNI